MRSLLRRYVLGILSGMIVILAGCAGKATRTYIMPRYDQLSIERVLVVPATGLPPSASGMLTKKIMGILRSKNAFDATLYVQGEHPEVDNAIRMAQGLKLSISDEPIRELAELYSEYDAILTIHQFSGLPGTEYEPGKLLGPRSNVVRKYPTNIRTDEPELEKLTAQDNYVILVLGTIPFGSELWRIEMKNKHFENSRDIIKRIPDDRN
jgi:hypothetical protein